MTLSDNKVTVISIRSVGMQTEQAFLDLLGSRQRLVLDALHPLLQGRIDQHGRSLHHAVRLLDRLAKPAKRIAHFLRQLGPDHPGLESVLRLHELLEGGAEFLQEPIHPRLHEEAGPAGHRELRHHLQPVVDR